MIFKKAVILVLFVLLISISGCIESQKMPGSGGVIIEKFEPVLTQKSSGEPLAIRVKIRNTGTETARDIRAELVNIEEFKTYNTPLKLIKEMRPDLLGGEGTEITWTWDLDAPSVPSGIKLTFNPMMRLRYTYKTTTVRTITSISIRELREYASSGKVLPSEATKKSRAPISVDISIKSPLTFSGKRIKFPVSITVKNIGGGEVCRGRCINRKEDMNVIDLYLADYDIKLESCNLNGIRLTGGSATIVCEGEMAVSASQVRDMDLILKRSIRVETVYTYIITKSTQITVAGK